jgi:threonine/homoserine/homoserine lactone efflux protein
MNLLIEASYKGLALGLALCISIGPSFFALIKTSIDNGYRSGIALAVGIFISDLICVALAYLGASQLFMNPNNKIYIGIIGGTILVVFGIFYFFQNNPTSTPDRRMEMKKINVPLMILKGFILNMFNPAVIMLWIAWVGLISSNVNFKSIHLAIFFTVALITILVTDILKSLAAHKIKRYLTPKILKWLNRVVGVILVIVGLNLIYKIF